MSYRHSMACNTEGIRPTHARQVTWVGGLVSIFWEAEGQPSAKDYYQSPDPRIVFFLNDVSAHIYISDQDDSSGQDGRPMTRAVCVPIWTRFTAQHSFSHLDVHVHHNRLLRFLSPVRNSGCARNRRPHAVSDR